LGVLEPPEKLKHCRRFVVSIPVRVLGVLEQIIKKQLLTKLKGFNPCKGFGGFGTIFRLSPYQPCLRFNPCKGFGGFGTGIAKVDRFE